MSFDTLLRADLRHIRHIRYEKWVGLNMIKIITTLRADLRQIRHIRYEKWVRLAWGGPNDFWGGRIKVVGGA